MIWPSRFASAPYSWLFAVGSWELWCIFLLLCLMSLLLRCGIQGSTVLSCLHQGFVHVHRLCSVTCPHPLTDCLGGWCVHCLQDIFLVLSSSFCSLFQPLCFSVISFSLFSSVASFSPFASDSQRIMMHALCVVSEVFASPPHYQCEYSNMLSASIVALPLVAWSIKTRQTHYAQQRAYCSTYPRANGKAKSCFMSVTCSIAHA